MKAEHKIGEPFKMEFKNSRNILVAKKCDSCHNCIYVIYERGAMGQFLYGCKSKTATFCKKPYRTDGNNIIYVSLKNELKDAINERRND
jgi:hypothetical protein